MVFVLVRRHKTIADDVEVLCVYETETLGITGKAFVDKALLGTDYYTFLEEVEYKHA